AEKRGGSSFRKLASGGGTWVMISPTLSRFFSSRGGLVPSVSVTPGHGPFPVSKKSVSGPVAVWANVIVDPFGTGAAPKWKVRWVLLPVSVVVAVTAPTIGPS